MRLPCLYTVSLITLLLTGCSLLGDKSAPVYDSISNKQSQKSAPAELSLPASKSGAESNSAAIEDLGDQNVAIHPSNTNPYDTNPNDSKQPPRIVTPATNSTATPRSGNTVASVAPDPRLSRTTSTSADLNSLGDPRVRDGESILSSNTNSTTKPDEIILRPGQSASLSKPPVENTSPPSKDALEPTPVAAEPASVASAPAASTSTLPDKPVTKSPSTPVNQPVTASNPPSPEPVTNVSDLSAVDSLLADAQQAVVAGNYDKAAASLERANRIEPKNAKILYDIAQIRYVQGNYAQAESFAGKATNLSRESGLSKKAWSLVSDARRAQGNESGADLAQKRAASY